MKLSNKSEQITNISINHERNCNIFKRKGAYLMRKQAKFKQM